MCAYSLPDTLFLGLQTHLCNLYNMPHEVDPSTIIPQFIDDKTEA